MHGSAGVETVCEVYRYSFQARKKVLFCGIAELERTVQESGLLFLLSLLGVEEDVIYEDYLRTNRYMEPQLVYMQRLVQTWPEADEKMTEKLPIIYNVKEEYLAAVFETVKKTYGSMEKFFQTVILSETENDRRVQK